MMALTHSIGSQLRSTGFSMIELVIFIVVVSIMITALFSVFAGATGGLALLGEGGRANQLAQQRMELLLARRRQAASFAEFLLAPDPCVGGTPPPQCTVPAGYTVLAPQITVSALGADFREIVVQVQGGSDATVRMLVAAW